MCPRARAGNFTVIDEAKRVAYIGCGATSAGTALADLWALDLSALEWTQIPLSGAPMSPRNGARGVLVGGRLLIFGGFHDGKYLADPFMIDPATGICERIETPGDQPSPRSTPVMAVSDDGRVFVWGGYNGEWPNTIHILDPVTRRWRAVPSAERGRTSVPSVQFDNKVLVYGGSSHAGMLILDMAKESILIAEASGAPPPPDVMKAGMVKVGRHVFFVGGRVKSDPDWTLLYCMDIERRWWFVFFVSPDGDSVTLADGLVKNGCFLLPRIHTFGLAYSEATRAIVAFLGCPCIDPPRLFLVRIGEAMGVINLRDDLRDMLGF
jgi:hypothetical protein